MSLTDVSNKCPHGRISSMWYHIYIPRERWKQLRSCLQRLHVIAERYGGPTHNKGKLSPSRCLSGCWHRHWTEHISQIYESKICANGWLDGINNFNYIGYKGINGWDHITEVVLKHCEAPFIVSKFKKRPNKAVKWRISGDNYVFSKEVLYNRF